MTIRALDEALPEIVLEFLERRVSARGREHWRWKYRIGEPGPPRAFYWQDGQGQVLGFVGLMPTALNDGRDTHPAAWFVDWQVAPGQGAVGIGVGLLRKAEAAAGTLLTLQGSADTRKILPRLGWKESRKPCTWRRPVGARFVSRWLGGRWSWLPGGVTRLAGAAASRAWRCPEPTPPAGAELVRVERLPDEHDRVWKARSLEFAPAMARDSAYLNHFCADFPGGGYRVWLLRRRGETVGHLITRLDSEGRDLVRGRLVDVLWPRAELELAEWLVGWAAFELAAAGADFLECVTSLPDLAAALRRAGFRSRGPVSLWYHCLPADVPSPDRWTVSLLDCDRAYR